MSGEIPGRILVVDDNITNLQLLVRILSNERYDISVAKSGEEAIEFTKRNPFDLILLDIMMPGIDGYTTCAKIKSHPDTREIPIIFLSALVDIESKTKGFAAGGVDYISKPFHEAEVLMRIQTHLSLSFTRRDLRETIERLSLTEEELKSQFEDLKTLSDNITVSEERFKGLAHLLPVPVFEASLDGFLTFTNQIGYRIIGSFDVEDLRRINFFDCVVPDERKNAEDYLLTIIRGNQIQEGREFTLQINNRIPFKAMVYMNCIYEPKSGVPIGLRVVLIDITERKRTEEALKRSQEKISILSGITRHDMVNQINALQIFLDLLEGSIPPTAEETRYIELIKTCCDMIDKHISFSKDYQDLGLNSPMWLNIEHTARMAAQKFLSDSITMTINTGNYELFADPMLMLIFYNLFENARKYGEKISYISVTFREDGK
ncbi:MAG TPA: response regulator, partial [Methanospirillum sp.]|nr:response regulator [Methanospirillum sp.]